MLGIILWFDGEEGMIRDVETKQDYYVYHDVIPWRLNNPSNLKGELVNFELYINLYMSQVDKVIALDLSPLQHNELIETVKELDLINPKYLDQHKMFIE